MEGSFYSLRQGYWYFISFLEKNKGLIDIELLKFKDDALVTFQNKILGKKQSDFQFKIIQTDGWGKYMREFNDHHEENVISPKVTSFYWLEQNRKAEEIISIAVGNF